MKKTVYNNLKPYIYDASRKGAKYSFDGGATYCNAGEAFEISLKDKKGFDAVKDANTAYNEGSDIEETRTSVKSWAFTLASACKGGSFEEIIEKFFLNVHSSNFSFGWFIDDELIEYNMNADEFKHFLYRFCKYDKHSRTVRGPKFSIKKMHEVMNWFEG